MTGTLERWARRLWPLVVCIVIIGLIAGLGSLTSVSIQQVIMQMLVMIAMVVALYSFSGLSGIMSFGNNAFVTVGAYVSALLTMTATRKGMLLYHSPHFLIAAHLAIPLALIVAGIAAGLFGLVVGLVLMRLSGLAASIGTMAILVITNTVAGNWTAVTGGKQTLTIPMYLNVWNLGGIVALLVVIVFVFQESSFGHRLKGSRDDEQAARAVGVRVYRERVIAFTLSAFLSGIAGVLYAHFLGSVDPDTFFFAIQTIVIAMLVVGGLNSLSGAVVGAVGLSFVMEALRRVENGFVVGGTRIHAPAGFREMGTAFIVLLVLMFLPKGVTRGKEFPWPFSRRARFKAARVTPSPSIEPAVATVTLSQSTGPAAADELSGKSPD